MRDSIARAIADSNTDRIRKLEKYNFELATTVYALQEKVKENQSLFVKACEVISKSWEVLGLRPKYVPETTTKEDIVFEKIKRRTS